jgi:DNA-binding transcriptional regulator YhcF (GntR family)
MIWAIDHSAAIPLRDQIVTCVRRGITTGQLPVGDQLPPAVELADALSVDRNTVLAAYRQLRSDGVLEFRRGRGVRVARATSPQSTVVEAAHRLIKVGSAHGLDREQLIQLIRELT